MSKQRILLCFIPFLSIFIALLASPTLAYERTHDLGSFQLGGIYAMQNGGNNSSSGQIGWTPVLNIFGLHFRTILAATLFKSSFSDSKFIAGEAQELISISLGSLAFEAGGGIQTWFGQSVTSPMLSGQLAWFHDKWFGLIDRWYAGYSYLADSRAKTHEIKLGIGISL